MRLAAADLHAPAPDAPPVEQVLALDMLKRSVWIVPGIVLGAGLVWGSRGAWSAIVAVGLVLANLLLAAVSLSWAARRSLTLLMAVALGGFIVRMGLVTVVMLLVRDRPW